MITIATSAPLPSARSRRGMTLLEVLMALAVFSVGAVALVQAINQMGHAVLEAHMFRNVDQAVESLMDEYSKRAFLQELREDVKAGADGVAYEVRVSQLNHVKNREGRPLQGLFKIEVTARWKENQQPLEVKAETVRNAALFQPVN
jgi:prepilin-type N-terminal cleavage/methylation domain-containing protein